MGWPERIAPELEGSKGQPRDELGPDLPDSYTMTTTVREPYLSRLYMSATVAPDNEE